jgi:rare lipoprotein A
MIATPLLGATLILWMSSGALPGGAPAKPQTGEASFYGPGFAGRATASGETFDPNKLTAASPTLPLGTKAKVTNTETGRSVNVTINDRGPYAENRVIDVTTRAAEHLGMKEDGVAPVKVQPLAVPKPKD